MSTAYPGLPLFTMQAPASKRRYLNEVFLLVLDDLPTWRSMNTYAVDTEAQLKLLAAADHLAIEATSSGAAFMAIPKLSKTLVSYLVGLMVTSSNLLPPIFAAAVTSAPRDLRNSTENRLWPHSTPSTANNERYKKFLQETLVSWFRVVRHVPCRACSSPSGPRLFGWRR